MIAGVPIGTVRSRLSRGREALRRILGIEEFEAAPATAERQHGDRHYRDSAARLPMMPVGLNRTSGSARRKAA